MKKIINTILNINLLPFTIPLTLFLLFKGICIGVNNPEDLPDYTKYLEESKIEMQKYLTEANISCFLFWILIFKTFL